jgi:Ser/Thr protein kinase RdoA (MazF antagonist)
LLDEQLRNVLAAYPPDLAPRRIQPLAGAGGFSGSQIWWLDTERGPACLRRWPKCFPGRERLEFIQAVLWHVDQEGFHLVPVPCETRTHGGYLFHDGYYWEIVPWMPGCADFHRLPCPTKLRAAMIALANFHLAAASFPLPDAELTCSPGIAERYCRLGLLLEGKLEQVARTICNEHWPELASRATRLCQIFRQGANLVIPLEPTARNAKIRLQPCIRDVWHDHILFCGQEVSGIVDFGAMRPECVSADIARLLGSMVQDDGMMWNMGLTAYQSVRPLTDAELQLVTAFDRTGVLMSGIQWAEWVFCEHRQFEDQEAVLARFDEIFGRLLHLTNHAV